MKNRALFLQEKLVMEFGEVTMPEAAAGEVVVRMEYVGICGSDLHFYETGYIGTTKIIGPHIVGHECAGVVTAVGADVRNIRVGDRVALEPGRACGHCEFCLSGRYNLCRGMQFISSFPYNGALCQYMSYPENLVFKLPDSVSTLEGALIEPLAVGLHAARQGGVALGQTAVILGAGCIGLTTLLACKAMSASQIIVTDLFDSRLETAKKLGADIVINAAREEVTARVLELTDGLGAQVVFEAAGNPRTTAQTIELARPGGIIVTIGNIMGQTPFDFYQLGKKELRVQSVWRYRNIFPLAISAVAAGRINIAAVVSDIFPFDQAIDAFDKARTDKEHVVKAVIKM